MDDLEVGKEMGFSVLLSGVGGDDLYSGYRRHKALYFERFWGWLHKMLSCFATLAQLNLSDLAKVL